jgi:pimeloyl-ACP methyl ester carboxylesterase
MAEITTESVETAVGNVQIRRGGSGDPLVYLHSAGGEGEGLELFGKLAETHAFYAPMFPGFGASEGIEQIDDMEDAVFHLLDLFDRRDLEAPAIIGLSLGGWMAAELATRYPERVSRLILVNPAGLYVGGAEIGDIFSRSPAEMCEDMFHDKSHPVAQLMLQMDQALSDTANLGNIPFQMIEPMLKSMAASAKLGWNPYLHNPKLRKRLHRITAPTLVIRAAHDTLIPAAHARVYADEVPGARYVEIEDGAHMVTIERPDRVASTVNEFLATVPQRT